MLEIRRYLHAHPRLRRPYPVFLTAMAAAGALLGVVLPPADWLFIPSLPLAFGLGVFVSAVTCQRLVLLRVTLPRRGGAERTPEGGERPW